MRRVGEFNQQSIFNLTPQPLLSANLLSDQQIQMLLERQFHVSAYYSISVKYFLIHLISTKDVEGLAIYLYFGIEDRDIVKIQYGEEFCPNLTPLFEQLEQPQFSKYFCLNNELLKTGHFIQPFKRNQTFPLPLTIFQHETSPAQTFNSNPEDQCAICRDLLSQNCKTLQCGHVLHEHCVREWWSKDKKGKRRCPLCRHKGKGVEISERYYVESMGVELVDFDPQIKLNSIGSKTFMGEFRVSYVPLVNWIKGIKNQFRNIREDNLGNSELEFRKLIDLL